MRFDLAFFKDTGTWKILQDLGKHQVDCIKDSFEKVVILQKIEGDV